MSVWIDLAESAVVPDALVRLGIRRLVGMRLAQEHHDDPCRRVLFNRMSGWLAHGGKVFVHIFFMACEELFGYRDGSEWLVCHYRFGKRSVAG